MTVQTFEGRVAIVTGAGVGIGYEIALQLAQAGAAVLLNDVDEALAHTSAQAIRQQAPQGKCVGVGGDVAEVATTRGFVAQAVAEFGRLDFAIANAGLTVWGDFLSYTPEMFDRLTGVNLRGSYFLAQAAAQQFKLQGQGGRIVLMSSVTGHQGIRYLSGYGMTKAALEMLARNLVVELSPLGVTVNCVAPGATLTPRNLNDDPHYDRSWGGVTPTGRVASPADIAHAVLFLLSDSARQITGQTLVVDGGWTAISPTPSLDFVEKREV